MAFNFDPKFEQWLDQKLDQIKSFGYARITKDILGIKDTVSDKKTVNVEDWDMESVTSEPEGKLPLRSTTSDGDYYQLMWNEGTDPTEDAQNKRLSARERVAKILRETEMKASSSSQEAFNRIPDLDDDDDESVQPYSDSGIASQPYTDSGIGEGETRHDVMENGYVQIGRISSTARDEMFDSWEYDDELGLDENENPVREAASSPNERDDLQIRFRKFKSDLDEMQAGEYIMDEEFGERDTYAMDIEPPVNTRGKH